MKAILRVAIDDSKFLSGTVLNAYSDDEELGPGQLGNQLCIMVRTEKSLGELRAMRIYKRIRIEQFMSDDSIAIRIQQKARLLKIMQNKKDPVIEHDDVTIKPRFDKVVDLILQPGLLQDTPEAQWPKADDLEIEERDGDVLRLR